MQPLKFLHSNPFQLFLRASTSWHVLQDCLAAQAVSYRGAVWYAACQTHLCCFRYRAQVCVGLYKHPVVTALRPSFRISKSWYDETSCLALHMCCVSFVWILVGKTLPSWNSMIAMHHLPCAALPWAAVSFKAKSRLLNDSKHVQNWRMIFTLMVLTTL